MGAGILKGELELPYYIFELYIPFTDDFSALWQHPNDPITYSYRLTGSFSHYAAPKTHL